MYDELTEVDIRKMKEEMDYRIQVLRPKLIEDVQTARAFGEDVAQRAKFGSSLRAGEDYRREICAVLVRRGLLAMEKEKNL